MFEKKFLGCLSTFSREILVTAVAAFRRRPCVDGDAVNAWRVFQIVDDMLHLTLVIKIGRVDVYAVYLIPDSEVFDD